MTEQEFAEALGMASFNTNILTYERAINWLRAALEKSISTQEQLDLRGTTVLAWDSGGMVLQDPEGKLYGAFVTHPFGSVPPTLIADQHSTGILDLLRNEGILSRFVSPIAVAEYLRLREGRCL